MNGSTDRIAVNAQYAGGVPNTRSVKRHWHDLLAYAGVTGFTAVGSDKCASAVIASVALGADWRNAISFDLLSLPTMLAGDCFKDHDQRYELQRYSAITLFTSMQTCPIVCMMR